MCNAILNFRCDWCGGEIEHFPNAKSGLRCKMCWRTEGKPDDGKFHRVERTDSEHYTNQGKEAKKT